MASTVTANTLAVATSTSSHIAATICDERLVQFTTRTPLPNYIESKYITRNFATTVLFDKGKVWNQPVEVGDMPKSMPVDTWPGANTGMINSYACAAPGAGSPNVFVAGKKVLCMSHTTEQNAHNSKGIITDRAGLDKLLKEYEDSLKKQIDKPDKDGTSGSQGGGSGAGGQEKKPDTPPKPPQADPPPAEGCAVSGVHMEESKRKPNVKGAEAPDAFMEVIAGAGVDFDCILGKKMCGEHPIWECSATGWKEKGEKAKFETPGGTEVKNTGLLSLGQFFSGLPNAKSTDYVITLTDHKGIAFRRTVKALPKTTATPAELELKIFDEFKGELTKVFGKIGLNFRWTIKPPTGKIILEGTWNAAEAGTALEHKCYYSAAIKGSCVVLDGVAELSYSLLNLPIPIPQVKAVLAIIKVLNEITEWACGRSLIDLLVFANVTGNISTTIGLEMRKYYQESFSLLPAATWELKGTITGAIGLRIEALAEQKAGGNALARGTGQASLTAEAYGMLLKNWPPGIQGGLKIGRPKLSLILEYDLTVLIASEAEEEEAKNRGWATFWQGLVETIKNPWGAIKKGWSSFTSKFKDALIQALGEGALKGKKELSVEFAWEETKFETPAWRLPI